MTDLDRAAAVSIKALNHVIANVMAEHYRIYRIIDVNLVSQRVLDRLPTGERDATDLEDLRRRVLSRACAHTAARW